MVLNNYCFPSIKSDEVMLLIQKIRDIPGISNIPDKEKLIEFYHTFKGKLISIDVKDSDHKHLLCQLRKVSKGLLQVGEVEKAEECMQKMKQLFAAYSYFSPCSAWVEDLAEQATEVLLQAGGEGLQELEEAVSLSEVYLEKAKLAEAAFDQSFPEQSPDRIALKEKIQALQRRVESYKQRVREQIDREMDQILEEERRRDRLHGMLYAAFLAIAAFF